MEVYNEICCEERNCGLCGHRPPYKIRCELFDVMLKPSITTGRDMTWRRCKQCLDVFKEKVIE